MQLEAINKIRNADFSKGTSRPTAWTWQQSKKQPKWKLSVVSDDGQTGGVSITNPNGTGNGLWNQTARCKAEQYYRIEALVTCDCHGNAGGLIVSLKPLGKDGQTASTVSTRPLRRAKELVIRGFYKTPKKTNSLTLSIGLQNATGSATIHHVRMIPVIEPEYKAYPLGIPAPSVAVPPPLCAESACVVTAQPNRPLIDLLKARLNEVSTCEPSKAARNVKQAHAIFFPDETPTGSFNTIAALKRLAKDKIVVVSLRYMEAISDKQLTVKTITQIDDPLHARIFNANFATHGTALRDLFAFAECTDNSTKSVQRQFKDTKEFTAFCHKHGFETLLLAVTDSEKTSEKPCALIHQTDSGALIVMDIEPAEAKGSTRNEPSAAAHLIHSILGGPSSSIGQYAAPARTTRELADHLNDFVDRFAAFDRSPAECGALGEVPNLITLGRELDSLGLPIVPRPVIMIRSGLTGVDVESVYGTIMWCKQLARPEPYVSPYAETLASKFRIAWMPLCAPLAGWGGFFATDRPKPDPIEVDFDPGTITALIDVTTTDQHRINVYTAANDSFHKKLAAILPQLSKDLISGRHFYNTVASDQDPANRSAANWRIDDLVAEVKVNPDCFKTPTHRAATKAGANMIRIEVPTTDTDSVANTIWQTDWIAMLLEQITGLLLGFVLVNRDPQPMKVTWPTPLKELRTNAVMRRINAPYKDLPIPGRGGKTITLPPGHAIVAVE